MENGDGTNGKRIRAEDVICKLKDDGDFDKLRLKIVRRMKENVSICLFFFGFCCLEFFIGLKLLKSIFFNLRFLYCFYLFLHQFTAKS